MNQNQVFIRTWVSSEGFKRIHKVTKSQIPNHRLNADLDECPEIWLYLGMTADAYGTIYEYFVVNPKHLDKVMTIFNEWAKFTDTDRKISASFRLVRTW